VIERVARPGLDVLDVGCGTGIAARQLRAAGCRVLGVEPDPRMAEVARGSGVDVEVAAFEDWDPAGRSFDAVVAATAWHWVDPVAGAVKAAQVLRPGGRLTVFGSAFQLPGEVADAFAAAFRRVAPDAPFPLPPPAQALDGYQRMYAGFAEHVGRLDAFGAPEQWRIDWTQTYRRDEWLDQMPTHGNLTRLPAGALAEVLDAVGAAIDAQGGTMTLPYVVVGFSAARS
jgi:SAM-dependent methyltransferase